MVIKTSNKQAIYKLKSDINRRDKEGYFNIINKNNIDIDKSNFSKQVLPIDKRYKNLSINKYKMVKCKKEKAEKTTKNTDIVSLSNLLKDDVRLGNF